jgi:uncharacterized protein (TIGR04141 family)
LAYGRHGFRFICPENIDPTFGLSYAIRTIDPEAVKQTFHAALASSGRTDDSRVAGTQHIRHFGLESIGEIVKRIQGKEKEIGLAVSSSRRRPGTVNRANSLQITLPNDPELLLQDLRIISHTCTNGKVPTDVSRRFDRTAH